MASTRIAELASRIAEHTTNLNNYLVSQGLPTPSFDPIVPPDVTLPDAVAASREIILDATDELHSIIVGPIGLLTAPYVSLTCKSRSLKHDMANEIYPTLSITISSVSKQSTASILPLVFPKAATRHLMMKSLRSAD